MEILLIFIVFIIAVVGWFKPKTVPRFVSFLMVGLLITSLIIQIVIERRQAREEAKLRYSGFLKSESKIVLSGKQKIYPKLEFGDSGSILVYAGPKGKPILEIFENNSLTILIEDGQVKVSTLVRDRNGRLVAELLKNEWKINSNNTFDRNYSKDALEVKDESGDIVLQVRLVEDRVQLQGIFYDPTGRGVALGKVVGPKGIGGGIERTEPNHPYITMRIQPIFKYPSDLHLGELKNE